jgi:excisionase family DNA binding protein
MHEGKEMLTVPEVAEHLRVTIETVRRWIRAGRIHAIKPGGPRSGWRIERSELERFVEEQRH